MFRASGCVFDTGKTSRKCKTLILRVNCVMKTVFKTTVFVFCFLWLVFPCEGKKVQGYIVTETRDTLYGSIYIYRFSLNTGLFFVNGIHEESYHYQVAFKENQGRKFTVYKPEDIQAFGFRFKDEDYVYQRIRLEKRSLVPGEKSQVRFFRLLYSNGFSLYRDKNRIRQASDNVRKCPPGSRFEDESMAVTDYYLYNVDIGLNRVDGSVPITELLKLYGIEAVFIDTLSEKVKARDILQIIASYEVWRTGNK